MNSTILLQSKFIFQNLLFNAIKIEVINKNQVKSVKSRFYCNHNLLSKTFIIECNQN